MSRIVFMQRGGQVESGFWAGRVSRNRKGSGVFPSEPSVFQAQPPAIVAEKGRVLREGPGLEQSSGVDHRCDRLAAPGSVSFVLDDPVSLGTVDEDVPAVAVPGVEPVLASLPEQLVPAGGVLYAVSAAVTPHYVPGALAIDLVGPSQGANDILARSAGQPVTAGSTDDGAVGLHARLGEGVSVRPRAVQAHARWGVATTHGREVEFGNLGAGRCWAEANLQCGLAPRSEGQNVARGRIDQREVARGESSEIQKGEVELHCGLSGVSDEDGPLLAVLAYLNGPETYLRGTGGDNASSILRICPVTSASVSSVRPAPVLDRGASAGGDYGGASLTGELGTDSSRSPGLRRKLLDCTVVGIGSVEATESGEERDGRIGRKSRR